MRSSYASHIQSTIPFFFLITLTTLEGNLSKNVKLLYVLSLSWGQFLRKFGHRGVECPALPSCCISVDELLLWTGFLFMGWVFSCSQQRGSASLAWVEGVRLIDQSSRTQAV